ncbi:GNAT family N-acetyltransferase [Paenibacillus chungangensis]|uniref:GNAT family N-acetyltransferase n=1 Tax=Paenibacillus chungangensis TaxID=696535 RepID=A0ABW3HKP4_9BACL
MAYRSAFYVYDQEKPVPVVIRNYTVSDIAELIAIQAECFPPPFPSELWWNEQQLKGHIALFPEGALCVEVGGELAGSLTGLRVDFNPAHPAHKWEEITDNGYIRNHNPLGNTLYIVDISVRPKHRKLGLGKHMMQAMYGVVIQLGLDRLLGGGRMPGYHKAAAELTPEQYVSEVIRGERRDPVLSFLLRCGRTPVSLVADYLDDEESLHYALLMEWRNPFKGMEENAVWTIEE